MQCLVQATDYKQSISDFEDETVRVQAKLNEFEGHVGNHAVRRF